MAKALAKGSRITGAQRATLASQYAKRYDVIETDLTKEAAPPREGKHPVRKRDGSEDTGPGNGAS